MTAVIIDDDVLNIKLVEYFCDRYAPSIEVVGTADHVEEGIAVLVRQKPDLLFLDVELHDKTGFEIISALEHQNLMVVMITAHEKYAVKAFRANVIDYLLKPLIITEFVRVVKKCETEYERRNGNKSIEKKFIDIVSKDHIEMLPVDQILHLKAQGNYTVITTLQNIEYLSSRQLNYFTPRLPDHLFLRVHHSHVINITGIIKIGRARNGKIVLSNNEEVPITEGKRKQILDRLIS